MSVQSLAQHRNTRTTPRCSGPNSSGQERLHAQAPPLSVRLRYATRRAQNLASLQQECQTDPKNLVIFVLAIAVAVLGSLYDESQQQRVVVDLPNLKIEAK